MSRAFSPFVAVLLLSGSQAVMAWGPNGHRIVAQIAHYHLTPSARKAVAELFSQNGRYFNQYSLAKVSTWPDDIRSDPAWNRRDGKQPVDPEQWNHRDNNKFWHYVTAPTEADLDRKWETANLMVEAPATGETVRLDNPVQEMKDGLLLAKLLECEEILRNPQAGAGDKMEALTWMVHLLGDVHQPLHVGNGHDRGGNHVAVEWFGADTNLHEVWDEGLIEKSALSFTEYAQFLDLDIRAMNSEELAGWAAADIRDWALESMEARSQCYQWQNINWENQPELGYAYAFDNSTLLHERLKKGGYRLAAKLNAIFGDL